VGTQVDLIDLMGLNDEEFRRRFRHTALWRTRRSGLLRNAAIALGNRGDARALPALEQAQTDVDPVIREAAAWAIARIRERAGETAAIQSSSS
jgi:epoxyqueuosine reductase